MGISSIQHNMLMMNADRQMRANTKKKAKSAEKLSSGYRINRAADDAAGLSISEKMRWMIRGLNQGTENAQDGVSWVQIGDGSLEEVHAMLHRMTELAIKSSNGTNTDDDRAMMQAEFDQLQTEIDRLTDNTYFNEQHIFQEHEDTYYQIEGTAIWPPDMIHTVREGENDLVMTYRQRETDPPKTVSITVPPGAYNTRELMDEIDSAIEGAGLTGEGIAFEYTGVGSCNLHLEGGEKIDEVSGGLSYLLFESYGGGTLGALIGTTVYSDEPGSFIEVEDGVNDYLTFKVISADGSQETSVVLDLDGGRYTKEMLMQKVDEQLRAQLDTANTGREVKVDHHGTGIMLFSPDHIITEFKGNMFEIDKPTRTGVFYDNVQHRVINRTAGQFRGGCVLYDSVAPSAGYENGDPEKQVLHIQKGVNNLLVLQPNGGAEVTIDLTDIDGNGKSMDGCTMRQLAAALNTDVFQKQGISLTASIWTNPPQSYNSYITEYINGRQQRVRYIGLTLTSGEVGVDSKVGINQAKSTAYHTLFTSKKVDSYNNDADFGGNDNKSDSNAHLLGEATIGSLEIKDSGDGQNDQFWLQLSDDSKLIKLDAKIYANASDLAAEIQNKIDAAFGADIIKVSQTGGQIRLDALKTEVTRIRVRGADGNNGYRDIFQDKDIIPDSRGGGNASNPTITLPEKAKVNADGTVYIAPAYGSLKVQLDSGAWRSVNVAGTWDSVTKLAEHITKALAPGETDIGCSLDPYNKQNGKNLSNTVTAVKPVDGGVTSFPSASIYKNKKGFTQVTTGEGGSIKYLRNDPATVTFGKTLSGPITITNDNKRFSFTLNHGKNERQVDIDLSTELGATTFSSAADFKKALQNAINLKLGKQPGEFGGVEVGGNGGTITLKAGLMDGIIEMSGQDDTLLSMDTSEGTFIWDLHKTSSPAHATLRGSSKGLNYSFKTKGEPELKLKLTKPGSAAEDITVKLEADHQYQNQTELLNDLKTKLSGKGITVSASGYDLVFSTTDAGKGYQLSVDNTCSAVDYLFGYALDDGTYSLKSGTPTVAYTSQDVKTGFTLNSGAEQNFTLTVNGTAYTGTLAATTYNTVGDIAAEIQKAINADSNSKGKGDVIKVTASGKKLRFETVAKGASATISLSYDKTSSMKKMFGTTPYAGAEASISADGVLTLKRIGGASAYGSVRVVSHDNGDSYQGGSFIFEKDVVYGDPKDWDDGYHSKLHSYMDGVDLDLNGGRVEIDQWNNKLTFYYTNNYQGEGNTTPKAVNISLPLETGSSPKFYTMEELRQELQDQIDAQAGADQMVVSVTEKGVRIEAKNAGRKYRIYTKNESNYYDQKYRPTGGFYDKILCSAGSRTDMQTPVNVDGKQDGNKVFAVGRQDVKNKEVKIQKDGNDTLSLEFSTPTHTGANAYKLSMTLEPGSYRGDELVKQIQKQLDKALVKAGLPAGLVEAVIGIENTHILGSLDDRALAFRLSDKVAVTHDGTYGIEAIGGTAAFSVFYATEGDITRAYIKGGRDISEGVTVKSGATDFSVDVDGENYKINLTPGSYSASHLAEHMTALFKAADCPLRAVEDGGNLKLMHTKYGKHKITHLSGSIKNELFFLEKGEKKDNSVGLRLSSVSGDRIEIDKPWMDTVSLGINTILISKYRYAQKAITRLKEAVTKVGDVRSYFGAMQNRLESTVRNNQNKAENTTAAESRIRDADISKEIMENTVHNILEQAGASMLTHAKVDAQAVLQLLT